MLFNNHSNYCWFFAFADSSAENDARVIYNWSAAFGASNALMSDEPKNSQNETVRLVAKCLRIPHHFTLPYSP